MSAALDGLAGDMFKAALREHYEGHARWTEANCEHRPTASSTCATGCYWAEQTRRLARAAPAK